RVGEVVRVVLGFFLSSRRRHTSSTRDWSSDVCSSDLQVSLLDRGILDPAHEVDEERVHKVRNDERDNVRTRGAERSPRRVRAVEIGRASCREREKATAAETSLHGKATTDRAKKLENYR